ncbi:hypothetical protein GYA19_02835 [Candidatus Beckwithbacteria bacterium]|nr:hypothetical protein [Candidatus Beckwithbacteria bacterium]
MQDQNLLKEALKKYDKNNYVVLSWQEYDDELNKLTAKIVSYVKTNNIHVDAVVPLLRGGNIPATFIAYKLDLLTILLCSINIFLLTKNVN